MRRKYFSLVVLLAFWNVGAKPSLAGGGEHFCDAGGNEKIERWPSGSFPLRWELVVGQQCGFDFVGCPPIFQMIVPGLPSVNCILAGLPGTFPFGVDNFVALGGDPKLFPGLQSIVKALETWNQAGVLLPSSLPGGVIATGGITGTSLTRAVGPSMVGKANPGAPGGGQAVGNKVKASTFEVAVPSEQSLSSGTWAIVQTFDPPGPAGFPNTVVSGDGRPMISFWENAGLGQFTLALTPVMINLSTGLVTDADIIFNTSGQGGQSFFAWTEFNNHTNSYAASDTNPLVAFADIEGVLVHELGHLAGLGHSLVDSTAGSTDTLFPSMFPVAQLESFAVGLVNAYQNVPSLCTGPGIPIPNTSLLIGQSARTLTPDDVAAIGDLYPSSSFLTELGSISGKVEINPGIPAQGAHLVAVHKGKPDEIRVGALSFSGGLYRFRGLPPGSYYLLVEPVDQGGMGSGSYFNNTSDPPNYVFQGPTGCFPIASNFPIEFFNGSNEAFAEPALQEATEITVSAGTETSGIDLKLGSGNDLLTVSAGSNPGSARGLMFVPGSSPALVNFRVQAPADLVLLLISDDRKNSINPFSEELFQVSLSANGVFPMVVPMTSSDGLNWSASLNALSLFPFSNLFAQAGLVVNGIPGQLSNALNVWMTQ